MYRTLFLCTGSTNRTVPYTVLMLVRARSGIGGVGDVEIKLPIRVAPHRRGLVTALYQPLLAEIPLVPHSHVTWVHIAL